MVSESTGKLSLDEYSAHCLSGTGAVSVTVLFPGLIVFLVTGVYLCPLCSALVTEVAL